MSGPTPTRRPHRSPPAAEPVRAASGQNRVRSIFLATQGSFDVFRERGSVDACFAHRRKHRRFLEFDVRRDNGGHVLDAFAEVTLRGHAERFHRRCDPDVVGVGLVGEIVTTVDEAAQLGIQRPPLDLVVANQELHDVLCERLVTRHAEAIDQTFDGAVIRDQDLEPIGHRDRVPKSDLP